MARLSTSNGVPVAAKAERVPLAARRHAFVAQFEKGLRRCDSLFEMAGEHRLVIGVSGGADSIALLLAAVIVAARSSMSCSRAWHLVPIVVHVHHHLRASADDDAAFARDLCARYGIEFRLKEVHPGELKGNLAANARKLRYKALQQVADELGAHHIAVAHHADDQLETMLIALCRGAGLDGLSGLRWSRRIEQGVKLIRPLLAVRKVDCEEFCRVAGIQWREDPSNRDVTKARARLRRDVMPVLHELWPNAARRVRAGAELIHATRRVLRSQLVQIFGPPSRREWDRRAMCLLPAPFIAAGLRRAALHIDPTLADRLNQRQLLQAAAAIQFPDRRTRRFRWAGGLQLKIMAKRVLLVIDSEERRK